MTPREQVRRMFRDAESAAKHYGEYIGDRCYTVPSKMTDAQRRAALKSEARRLAGQPDSDNDLDVTTRHSHKGAGVE